MRCSVATCNIDNRSKSFDKNIKFFGFPKNKTLQGQWLHACKRDDKVNVKNARVCSIHFAEESYIRNLKYELLGLTPYSRQKSLKPNAIPTLNLPSSKNISKSKLLRKERQIKREQAKLVQNILNSG